VAKAKQFATAVLATAVFLFALEGIFAILPDAEYEEVADPVLPVGRWRSTAPSVIHGITVERNYEAVVSYFTITPEPGIAGPEVLIRQDLPPGTEIDVLRVERCTNCLANLFGESFRIQAVLASTSEFRSAPVYVRHGALSGEVAAFRPVGTP
jgi:hypothetical protein